jgi:DNA-binding CsgD family transcriptional regulator/PAS domain-containing protein
MVTVEDFSRLVSGIYAAATAPQHWQMAMREIHCAVGGTNSGLFSDHGTSSLQNTVPREAIQSYAEYYYRLDGVLAAVERGPVGEVRTGSELMPLVRNSEFYEGFLRPLDIDDGLFVRLTDGPRPTCFIVAAPGRADPFDTLERVKVVSSLVPHFQQALRIHGNLAALSQNKADLASALDAVRHGIVIVGPDCWVLDLNSAAEAILRVDDGVHVHAGRIGATNTVTERRLYRALQAALVGDGSEVRSGRSFTCERPSGKRPYVIHVLPLHRTWSGEMPREARASVLIIDPEQESEPSATLLRRLFGLTRSEAEVAVRIARGGDVKEIAEELSVSLATVRTHLQHVFDKTDTHRQSELVRRLLTLSP